MRNDKEIALGLRRGGLSYYEISKTLGVPKSTLSGWFSRIDWSVELKKKLTKQAFEKSYPAFHAMREANSLRWRKWRESARKEAEFQFFPLSNNPLFIAGVMIYWGEGDKIPKNPIRVSNTDPQMLAIFRRFLINVCGVPSDRIKASLIIYPDLSDEICRDFWVTHTGVPSTQFYKTQTIQGKHKTKRSPYGICVIQTSTRQLKEKILVWIEKFAYTL